MGPHRHRRLEPRTVRFAPSIERREAAPNPSPSVPLCCHGVQRRWRHLPPGTRLRLRGYLPAALWTGGSGPGCGPAPACSSSRAVRHVRDRLAARRRREPCACTKGGTKAGPSPVGRAGGARNITRCAWLHRLRRPEKSLRNRSLPSLPASEGRNVEDQFPTAAMRSAVVSASADMIAEATSCCFVGLCRPDNL